MIPLTFAGVLGIFGSFGIAFAVSSILPILILNVIRAKEAAYFYAALSIASLLYAIPNSMFMSMFVEGSHGEPLRKTVIKSLSKYGSYVLLFTWLPLIGDTFTVAGGLLHILQGHFFNGSCNNSP